MKKTLLAILVTAMLLSLVFVPAAAVKADDETTITVWCWDKAFNIYAMETAAKIYQKDHPNVKVDVIETAWDDVQTKITAAVTGNQLDTLPDILLMQDNAIQKNVENYPDVFAQLEDSGIDYDEFAKYKVGVATVDDHIYNVPFDNGATGLFLRTDLLEEAGFKPEDFADLTWDEFIEKGKVVLEKTGKPMLTGVAGQPDLVVAMMQTAGKGFFKEDGELDMAENEALIQAMKVYAKMVKEGVFVETNDWDQFVASFNNDNCIGVCTGCWIIGSIRQKEDQSGKWAMVTTPRLDLKDAVNYSNVGGSGWVVLENSKNKEAAIDFLKATFAGSKELYETILPESGALATWLPAADSEVYTEKQEFFGGQKIYEELTDYASKVLPVNPGKYHYEARDAVGTALTRIVQGEDFDKVLKEAIEEVEFNMD